MRFRRSRAETDLERELAHHLYQLTAEYERQGYSHEEASRMAKRAFGGREQVKEQCRDERRWSWLSGVWQDIVFGVRMLRKTPAITAAAIVSLALGIGANTLVFSAVEHVILRGLPYPQSEKLFAIWVRSAHHGSERMHVSAADFYDWRAKSRSFQSMAAYASWPMNLTNIEQPLRLETQLVSANFFSALRVNAQIGRIFLSDEDEEHSPSVVVLSHRLWLALGGSPHIVGSQLTLNGSPATVVGVMPAEFAFPSPETDAWVPLSLSAANRANREGRWLAVLGRLKRGVTERAASAEMDVICRQLAAAYPASNAGWSAALFALQEEVVGKTRPILWTLQTGVLLLLLITCANLANLMLAKGTSRAREMAVRAALGAGRARILRQLVIESAILAIIGGGTGVAVAFGGISFARRFAAGIISRAAEIQLSGSVLLFAVAVTAVAAVVFGFVPALQLTRFELREQIGSGARTTPRSIERKRALLVATEAAVAALLLVGAALLGKSLDRLVSVNPGLQTHDLLSLRLTLPHARYPTNATQIAFFRDVLERVRRLPGVAAAAEISDTPLKGNNPSFEFVLDGVLRRPEDAPIQAGLRAISVGYLKTAGIPLLRGRDFTSSDLSTSTSVALVNQAAARRYWPNSDPIGKRLRLREDQRWLTIDGVVPDIKHMGLKAEEGPVVYIPYAQKTQDWLAWATLLVRTTGPPAAFVAPIRGAIHSVDKNQPVSEVATLDELLVQSTAMPRFVTAVMGVISVLALLIAMVGIYGILSYSVAERIPELGIRLTLGASPLLVLWLLLRETMLRVLGGMAVGLLCAWWLAQSLESQLFAVPPHDLSVFAVVTILLIFISLAAVLVPGRRAMTIDPAAAVRTLVS
jgi:putative ABC transport system permease protein